MKVEIIDFNENCIDFYNIKEILNEDSEKDLSSKYLNLLNKNLDVKHVSVWGRDDKQRCIYLLDELPLHTIEPINHKYYVIDFSDGDTQKYISKNEDITIYNSSGNDKINSDIINSFLSNEENQVILFSSEYLKKTYYYILVIKAISLSDLANVFSDVKIVSNLFLHSILNLREKSLQQQINKIINSKFSRSGMKFVKTACEKFSNLLSPLSFSLWLIIGEDIEPYYFSNGDSDETYKLDEGLTGYVARHGKPIFLHTVKNAELIYNTAWLGKVNDYGDRMSNPEDHVIIIPLVYPQKVGGDSKINGLIRLVKKNTDPSFWESDFSNALILADILSVLLYQDYLLSGKEETMRMHDTLIDLMGNVLPNNSLDDIFLSFMEEIDNWPGLIDWKIINEDTLFSDINISEKNYIVYEELINKINSENKDILVLPDNSYAYPIIVKSKITSFFIAKIIDNDQHETYEWLKTVVLIIGYIYANGILIEETQRLRDDNEEKQLQSLTSTVYRLYAHEALNGIKAIESWIKNSKRSSPDYQRLEVRTKEIRENITELLESTQFIKFKNRDCNFNYELETCLNRLGLKNQKKFGNCTIKLSITGFKQKYVNFDPNILIPIINNLVLNAREQYTQSKKGGPIEIMIVDKFVSDQNWIGFEIRDYAIGIPTENIDIIFNAGWSTKKDGQGLGLWIVKKLVEGSDGKISLNSTFGHYTSFEIIFPIIDKN